ncbi:Hypothetical predicted protein [Octopus vulgaris]|uniref:Uncharacterized protein n=1 Tax=Octopus vulgaris TaxID=6645 RepID=A0AA36AT61_OCTVU|nr:Hypothetical predicted protein [Octopus vulgaris]
MLNSCNGDTRTSSCIQCKLHRNLMPKFSGDNHHSPIAITTDHFSTDFEINEKVVDFGRTNVCLSRAQLKSPIFTPPCSVHIDIPCSCG